MKRKHWHTHTSKLDGISRGKKLKRMISVHSFPSLSIRRGQGACCGVGGKQRCCYADPSTSVLYKSSCLWGSSAISTPSSGFLREHNLPGSHLACSAHALWKESRHFQNQRSSLDCPDSWHLCFLLEDRGMTFSTGEPENSGFFFTLKRLRAYFLTLSHNLKVILSSVS